jgi:hypothetical protein
LFAKMADLERTNAEQREEFARLKGLKDRPEIKPSGMETATEPANPVKREKRCGRGKIRPRVMVEDRIIKDRGPGRITLQGLRDLYDAGACAVGACGPLSQRTVGHAGRLTLNPAVG